ncbi:MAG TPA: hydrogenase maturation protease [Deltaproteobacteria bacterium]|nr:hydrogenase maturation protease [Deltaproteobacteria bacterium]HPR52262.1 hydrogenase maturation protease [Deltaproteobacteria bacterium]
MIMNQVLSKGVKEALLPSHVGLTAYVLMGNTLRGDDGAGAFIAEQLPVRNNNFIVIKAGNSPEKIFYQVLEARPVKVVIIDAADFKGIPGEIQTFPHAHLYEASLSTHQFPLKVIAQLIEEDVGCVVHLVGIQISGVRIGSPMDSRVTESAQVIIDHIRRNLDERSGI